MAGTRPPRRTRGLALLSAAAVCSLTAGTLIPAAAAPAGREPARPVPVDDGQRLLSLAQGSGTLTGGLSTRRSGRHDVFVQLAGAGAADVAARAGRGARASVSAARDRRQEVARQAEALVSAVRGVDRSAVELFSVSNAIPGIALRVDSAGLRLLAARQDVVKVSPLTPRTLTNASAVQLTKVAKTWRSRGLTGEGVTIGVMDSGIDFTHADFGGVGTPEAYAAAKVTATDPGWRAALPGRARTKIIGGHDFVGDTYDASSEDQANTVPQPDPNPLDCNEHGTHVSGTAAGYGVSSRGNTFSGRYSRLTGDRLDRMRIGPGTAPRAGIYALKVFGCEGSTDLVIAALDRALDPDGDGDFSDHLDVVNMSLGAEFAPVDDPQNAVVDELSQHGVLTVASMGNSGDLTDAGGSPGSAVSSLAVASSVDAQQLRDGLEVHAPTAVAGVASGQTSTAYDWRGAAPVTGDVVTLSPDNADGCDPLSSADAQKVDGNIAWLEWEDNDATRRCGSAARSANVKAAGAAGVLLTSQLNLFNAGILGDPDLPVFQLTARSTERLRPAAEAGTLNVTFDGSLIGTIKDATGSIADLLSSFSSRGPHGSLGVVKPDVTAPGETITSAGMGSGDDQLTISGTSMAAPHTAGIAALVRSEHPRWSVLEVKAAVMNGAVHDVWTGESRSGHRYGPARVGSGRVDARRTTTTQVLAYSRKKDRRVSVSFRPKAVAITTPRLVRSQKVVVQNTGRTTTTATLSYDAVTTEPGISYDVSPATLEVPGRATRTVTVTMTVRPSELRRTIDPTMDTEQLDLPRQFVPDASGHLVVKPDDGKRLRVPVYGAAEPASETSTTASDGQLLIDGAGVSQGRGSERHRSLLSVLELGDRSGTLPVCTSGTLGGCTYSRSSRAGDLEYVGAGSTSEWLWFGVATRADWATVGRSLIPYVDYDVDGDGEPDFETYAEFYPDTDLLLAITVDLEADPEDALVDLQPVNFEFGDVDTNVFDSNVLLLPVSKAVLPAPDAGGRLPITYTVGTVDTAAGAELDRSAPVGYDAGTPEVQTDGPLFEDQGGTAIDYTLNGAAAATGAEALVLHLHGKPRARAEVIALP